jgi:hypothetical protein
MSMSIYEQWLSSFEMAGLPAINTDTCARIMAVFYVYGNNEAFTLNHKLVADLRYIQRRFGLYGTCTPNPDFIDSLKGYIKELEECEGTDCGNSIFVKKPRPNWCTDLFKSRYGFEP